MTGAFGIVCLSIFVSDGTVFCFSGFARINEIRGNQFYLEIVETPNQQSKRSEVYLMRSDFFVRTLKVQHYHFIPESIASKFAPFKIREITNRAAIAPRPRYSPVCSQAFSYASPVDSFLS